MSRQIQRPGKNKRDPNNPEITLVAHVVHTFTEEWRIRYNDSRGKDLSDALSLEQIANNLGLLEEGCEVTQVGLTHQFECEGNSTLCRHRVSWKLDGKLLCDEHVLMALPEATELPIKHDSGTFREIRMKSTLPDDLWERTYD